jgi:hypothetical protein
MMTFEGRIRQTIRQAVLLTLRGATPLTALIAAESLGKTAISVGFLPMCAHPA